MYILLVIIHSQLPPYHCNHLQYTVNSHRIIAVNHNTQSTATVSLPSITIHSQLPPYHCRQSQYTVNCHRIIAVNHNTLSTTPVSFESIRIHAVKESSYKGKIANQLIIPLYIIYNHNMKKIKTMLSH